jgi:fumarylacetoacetate (FAA) hydrolase
MRLATLDGPGRDGRLCVVSADGRRLLPVPDVAPTLQAALDDWAQHRPLLERAAASLENDAALGQPLDAKALAAPLPRSYAFLDGSVYLNHMELVRRARGAELPPTAYEEPALYQGASDGFTPPTAPILVAREDFGIDFEAEIGVIVDDVPMGVDVTNAAARILLLVLLNDVSLRELVPAEFAKGFGFLNSKPRNTLAPFVATLDEVGQYWRNGLMHLPLSIRRNGQVVGALDCGADAQFNFPHLIAHAARTRPLAAGTIIGAGTVSNRNPDSGVACLAELRALEAIEHGERRTPYLRFGDRVQLEVHDGTGRSLFGAIDQYVQQAMV